MKSKFLTLKKTDFWKGLIVALLTAFFSSVVVVFQNGIDFKTLNWFPGVSSTVIAFCSYILKNLFTNSNDQFLKPDNKNG